MEINTFPTTQPYQNLRAFRRATTLATDIFWTTRKFPREEKLALTDQMRRTAKEISQSVVNSWKERYILPVFKEHIDEGLNACTRLQLWLDFAHDCEYINPGEYETFSSRKDELIRMLHRLHNQRLALLA